jgi:hypothetical protein
MYIQDYALSLGPANAGLTDLRAQLVDTSGVDVGSAVSTGFVEIGSAGHYLWHYASFPDGHRGGVKFYSNAAPSTILLFGAINPEEMEATAIADAVLSRGVSNVQDTADTTSLAALILATFESGVAGTVWTIRKTGGSTFVVKSLILDATATPIIGVT